MLQSLLLTITLASLVFGGYVPPAPTITTWVKQPIDHSSPAVGTYEQKLLIYDHFWRQSSRRIDQRPIFFTPGGEAGVRGGYDHNGLMFQFGEAYGALLVFPEHRYYGDSVPFGKQYAHTLINVTYLTVENAILDYINVIDCT